MIDYAKIDTTINIGGIAFHQPVTAFTDCIISILCFCFYLQLKKIETDDQSTINWKRFYLLLSLASLTGGCAHAFFAVHEGIYYKSFWFAMQWLNIFSAYTAQQATWYSVISDSKKKNTWKWSYPIQLIVFSIAVVVFSNFLVVVIDSAIALIPVMVFHFNHKDKFNGSKWIGRGIAVLFCSAIIHGTKLSINEYFTYLDIAHVFIIINLSMIFFGIKQNAIS